ncbi:MAG TPA: hypothetical protein VG779_06000 [Actinomycetota bacterium]|nr:hypothetical protein [Actinomycetota bacterium]
MFTLLLAMCAAGALGPARAEAAVPRPSQMAGVRPCPGAIDASGTGGAGIGRLIELGHGIYDFVLQPNRDTLIQFSPEVRSLGYRVTYSVNGRMARSVFAGDLKSRPGNEHIRSKQRIQGRHYTPEGTRRKKDVVRTGDILQLKIVDYLVDPVQGRVFPLHGTITCQV